jgi:hypothetical protein
MPAYGMALLRHAGAHGQRPLSGLDRTQRRHWHWSRFQQKYESEVKWRMTADRMSGKLKVVADPSDRRDDSELGKMGTDR